MTKTPLEALNLLLCAANTNCSQDQADRIVENYNTIAQALTGAGEPVEATRAMQSLAVLVSLLKEGRPEFREHYERVRDFIRTQTPTPDPDTVPVRREDLEVMLCFYINNGATNEGRIRRLSQALQVK